MRVPNWNASSGSIDEQITFLVLLDLAEQNSQVNSILLNNQPSYPMTNCGTPFNMKEYLQHKVYANFTLKGNARQLARTSYYDIDYTRFTQTMENVKTELCDLLTSEIGADVLPPTEPSDPAAGIPIALLPKGVVNTVTPTFTWTGVSGTMLYAVTVRDNNGIFVENHLADSNDACSDGVCTYIRSNTQFIDGTYHWNVRAINSDGSNGANSNTLNFTVETQNNAPDQIDDTCQQGQAPIEDAETLIIGNAVCLQDVSNGEQLQMHLYVADDKVGSTLEIILNHGAGNSTLLHKQGGRPNITSFDHISNNPGNTERIVVDDVQSGWNYIHVQADDEFSGITLLPRYIQ